MGIYYRHNGELELIKNIYNVNGQDITVLQPGEYKLIYRETMVKESESTKTQDFTIKSGEMKHITLQ